jgi:DNA-binding transcriptional regulator YiaG
VGRRQQWVYNIEPEAFPADFPQRLDAFRQAAGFSWRGLSRQLKVNSRTVRRWKAGAAPGSGHLVSLFSLAAEMGLLHLLLPELGEPEGGGSPPG